MTDRQREVLVFITAYLDAHGTPPTLEEIAQEIGVVSRSTAHSHVQALVRLGQLEPREVVRELREVRYFPVELASAA